MLLINIQRISLFFAGSIIQIANLYHLIPQMDGKMMHFQNGQYEFQMHNDWGYRTIDVADGLGENQGLHISAKICHQIMLPCVRVTAILTNNQSLRPYQIYFVYPILYLFLCWLNINCPKKYLYNISNKKCFSKSISISQRPMSQHPIRKFIDQTFPTNNEPERTKWSQYFIDQKCDRLEQLINLTEDQWTKAAKTIPKIIIDGLKLTLSQARDKLTSQDKKQISRFLNEGLNLYQILSAFNLNEDSPKGLAIVNEVKSLIKPPKPQPAGCKLIPSNPKQPIFPLYLYHVKKLPLSKYYTVLVIGEKGSGKTALLDSFVNKLTGMEFNDIWRWILAHEDRLQQVPLGKSRTSQVKIYYVNDIKNRFNIRIIDTPSFENDKEIKADDEIVQQFESLFREVTEIDYVLLAAKSSETRLGPGTKYLYTRIQQLFSEQVKDRFLLMSTFTQESILPPCIQAFQSQGISFQKYFPFHSSAIYTSNRNCATHSLWKMCLNSIQALQNYIIQADKCSLSLKLSKQALQVRKSLEKAIKLSQDTARTTCNQLKTVKQDIQALEQNKSQIQSKGSYTKYETITTYQYKDLGECFQMCSICKVTCCQVCHWPPHQPYSICTYFNGGKGCPKCPGNCSRHAHVRTNDYITKVVQTKAVVVQCKRQPAQQGLSSAQVYQAQMDTHLAKTKTLSTTISQNVNQIKENFKQLQVVTLQPRVWTDEEICNEMVREESERKEEGWTQRKNYIQEVVVAITRESTNSLKQEALKLTESRMTAITSSLQDSTDRIEDGQNDGIEDGQNDRTAFSLQGTIESISRLLQTSNQRDSSTTIDKCLPYFNLILFSLILLLSSWHSISKLAFVYLLLPLLDEALPKEHRNPSITELSQAQKDDQYIRKALYVVMGLSWAIHIKFLFVFSYLDFSFGDIIPLLCIIFIGANHYSVQLKIAHELMHRPDQFYRMLATAHISNLFYTHYPYHHLSRHHQSVATPLDPSYAPKGQNVYDFIYSSVVNSFQEFYEDQKKKGKKFIRNHAVWSIAGGLLYARLVYLLFGMQAFLLHSLMAFGAIVLLEANNYMEHYGLEKKKIESEQYQQVSVFHSWNFPRRMTNYFFFKLQHLSHHYEDPQQPFQKLVQNKASQFLPHGYALMLTMAFFPKVWFEIMNPLLQAYQKVEVNKGERLSPQVMEVAEAESRKFLIQIAAGSLPLLALAIINFI